MSLEIRYIDVPDGAQEDMEATLENGNDISNGDIIPAGAEDVAWATLEPNSWVLNGTRKIMPDSPEVGFWSAERSGDDGIFANPPKITLHFGDVYSSTGLTFRFSPSTGEWCSGIRVSWYNENALLFQNRYFPTSANWDLAETVESFDRIEIELLATNKPGYFAKVQSIIVGRYITFSENELIKAKLVNEADPTLCELSVDTLSFEFIEPEGRRLIPQENQRVELVKDGITEASHFITSSNRESKTKYAISCQSAIGLLEGTYMGGIYKNVPVTDLLSDVLEEWEYELDSAFENATITGYLPILSQRNALQQIAFAIGALVTTRGNGKIKLVPLPSRIASRFSKKEIKLGAKLKTDPRIAKVEVVAHSYVPGEEEETLMEEESVSGKNLLMTFTEPHHSYSITGGTILSSDVNWVRIDVGGAVTLTGKKYIHNTVTYSKESPKATAREKGNTFTVEEATLINSGNAQSAVDRLYSVNEWRQTASQNVVVRNQRAGQMTSSYTAWDTLLQGFISSMDSTFTGNGHTAKIEIIGVEVTLQGVYPYSGEIYSGDTEVVY